jgi:hypothetical protein
VISLLQQIPTVWYYLIGWGIGGFVLGLLASVFLHRYVGE